MMSDFLAKKHRCNNLLVQRANPCFYLIRAWCRRPPAKDAAQGKPRQP